jgi:oxygen-dependent protoporphyrinogen oxidase
MLHPLPAGSVLGIPTRILPYLRTRLFSWRGKIRMGAELFVPPRRDEADESIGAFMTRRFGAEATANLAEPLLAGIHAGDVDRLSMASLFPRFTNAERAYGSLIRAFRKQPRGAVSVDGPFRSLPGGLSDLVRALVAALPNGAIRYRTPIRRLERQTPDGGTGAPPIFRIETASGEWISARAVVFATPAYATSPIVRGVDDELSALCAEVRYTSTATIVTAFARASVGHPLGGSGFVVPRVENSRMLAVSWLSSKWPHRAPDDRVLLRTFAGGARDPHALERSDSELVAESLNAIRPLLGVTGNPLLTRVYRWARANAQHEVGHLKRLETLERSLARHPGLFVTGSGFRGVGIPDCIADGRATGRQAAEWLQKKA